MNSPASPAHFRGRDASATEQHRLFFFLQRAPRYVSQAGMNCDFRTGAGHSVPLPTGLGTIV
jgi:hypothetical protein